jgi:hypothetical protein
MKPSRNRPLGLVGAALTCDAAKAVALAADAARKSLRDTGLMDIGLAPRKKKNVLRCGCNKGRVVFRLRTVTGAYNRILGFILSTPLANVHHCELPSGQRYGLRFQSRRSSGFDR